MPVRHACQGLESEASASGRRRHAAQNSMVKRTRSVRVHNELDLVRVILNWISPALET
jgi:hypothetical protein